MVVEVLGFDVELAEALGRLKDDDGFYDEKF